MSDFTSLNINPIILKNLEAKGYKTPTPIQEKCIPILLAGKDILGIAQTGTGKTAAFAIPILNKLANNKVKTRPARVRALILTPTRELASQIHDSFKTYGKGLNLSSMTIFGGVGARPQIQGMSRGVDILVATPGRLLDLMNEGHVLYEQLEVFVLDEADRMLDMGFIHDVKRIISKIPANKQTMLFSATMAKEISSIAQKILVNPIKVEITPEATTVDKIEQKLFMISKGHKSKLLESILKQDRKQTVLIFTRTKHGADRVVKNLISGHIECAAIHGNKSQGARERALNGFRQGTIRVLVATDIAARGIDVAGIGLVVNYDLPNDPEIYVHRIGRTARAGRSGVAITFCDQELEMSLLRSVEKLIRQKIPLETNHAYHGVPPVTPIKTMPHHQRGRPGSNRSSTRAT